MKIPRTACLKFRINPMALWAGVGAIAVCARRKTWIPGKALSPMFPSAANMETCWHRTSRTRRRARRGSFEGVARNQGRQWFAL